MQQILKKNTQLTYTDMYEAIDILLLLPGLEQERAWNVLQSIVHRFDQEQLKTRYAEPWAFIDYMRYILDKPERPDYVDLYDAIDSLIQCEQAEREEAWHVLRAIMYKYENMPFTTGRKRLTKDELIALIEQSNCEQGASICRLGGCDSCR